MNATAPKYRYLIFNLFESCHEGTNSLDKASELASCDDFHVVDSATGETLTYGGSRYPVENLDEGQNP